MVYRENTTGRLIRKLCIVLKCGPEKVYDFEVSIRPNRTMNHQPSNSVPTETMSGEEAEYNQLYEKKFGIH